MRDERFEVTVTALRQPVTALSLGGLRQRRCRPRNEIPRPSASVVPGAAHCAGGGSNGAAPAAGREQPAWRAPVFSPRDNGAARLHGRSGQLGSDREKHRAPAAGSPRRGRKSRPVRPWGSATGPLPLVMAGAVHHFAGRKHPMSESQSVSRSRLELVRKLNWVAAWAEYGPRQADCGAPTGRPA
jgi:hypothetical protein